MIGAHRRDSFRGRKAAYGIRIAAALVKLVIFFLRQLKTLPSSSNTFFLRRDKLKQNKE